MIKRKATQKQKEQQKQWRETNRERNKELKNRHYKRYPLANAVEAARSRAKEKKLPFNISAKDFEIPTFCPVLGIPLMHRPAKEFLWNQPSLDRIIPELGYIKGNVRVISLRANTLKNNATIEELRLVLKDLEELKNKQA